MKDDSLITQEVDVVDVVVVNVIVAVVEVVTVAKATAMDSRLQPQAPRSWAAGSQAAGLWAIPPCEA